MPDIFIVSSKTAAEKLRPHIKKSLGPALRSATSVALQTITAEQVAVYLLVFEEEDNAPDVQILGIASWSKERELLLENWRNQLAVAWYTWARELQVSITEVEAWPIMPVGSWTAITSKVVAKLQGTAV